MFHYSLLLRYCSERCFIRTWSCQWCKENPPLWISSCTLGATSLLVFATMCRWGSPPTTPCSTLPWAGLWWAEKCLGHDLTEHLSTMAYVLRLVQPMMPPIRKLERYLRQNSPPLWHMDHLSMEACSMIHGWALDPTLLCRVLTKSPQ